MIIISCLHFVEVLLVHSVFSILGHGTVAGIEHFVPVFIVVVAAYLKLVLDLLQISA